MSTSHLIDIAGHKLSVLAGGDASGPPVVFLHGILGSERFWPAVLPVWVKQTVRWYSVSLPGHFPSRLPADVSDADLSADSLTDVLGQLIQRLVGTERVSLAGWSTGASLALQLAARQPKTIRGVLSIAGFARGRWHGVLGTMQKLAQGGFLSRFCFRRALAMVTANDRRFRWALSMMADRRQPAGDETARNVLSVMRGDAARHDAEAVRRLMASIRDWNVADRMRTIRVPVTIAGGDGDRIISYRHTCQLAKLIPHARLATFAGMGHTFFGQDLQEFHARLRDWLMDATGLSREASEYCGAQL